MVSHPDDLEVIRYREHEAIVLILPSAFILREEHILLFDFDMEIILFLKGSDIHRLLDLDIKILPLFLFISTPQIRVQ